MERTWAGCVLALRSSSTALAAHVADPPRSAVTPAAVAVHLHELVDEPVHHRSELHHLVALRDPGAVASGSTVIVQIVLSL
jgi:hypothetical protein